MAREIIINPANVWKYFQSNKVKLMNVMHKCADDGDGLTVWMTNDGGDLTFIVYDHDSPETEYLACDEDDAEETYSMALDDIGFSKADDCYIETRGGECDEFEEQEFEIDERETELDEICEDLIYKVIGSDSALLKIADIEEAVKTVKEVVCDILAKQYRFPLYRPMFLIGNDGEKFYAEYPYPHLVEDEVEEIDKL